MRHLFAAALAAGLVMLPAAAFATVDYTLTGQFQADTDNDGIDEIFNWIFSFSTPGYLTTTGNIAPSSCSISGSFYACGTSQYVDPNHSFGGAIDDDYVGFNSVNIDGSGSGTAFYFFQAGAFEADGVYTDVGQPNPNGPTGDGGLVGNAGFATLTVQTVTSAVPEPASWAMMMLGFGLAGGAMRRRGAVPAVA